MIIRILVAPVESRCDAVLTTAAMDEAGKSA